MLTEIIRWLLIVRNERKQRLETLFASLETTKGDSALTVESIVTLIQQHMALPKSSRLPVLVIAAAYQASQEYIGERYLPLEGHNAADKQTGALGDVQIVLSDDTNVVTVYEMKTKRITREDIEIALQKLQFASRNIDNYIFITTDLIEPDIKEYAATIHSRIGVEFVILDCIGFIRHFLHFFYRMRIQFLDAYQSLVLNEADSAVNPSLKEAFLAMRLATENGILQSGETTESNFEVE